jgi:hypothetical protein
VPADGCAIIFLKTGNKAMKTPPTPSAGTSTPERQSACRIEVEAAMRSLIKEVVKRGWSPAEVALTLADASEDYVMELAGRSPTQH